MNFGENFESKINRSDYKILVVDDVVSNVLLLKILLTNEKFQVLTANNGTSCIEMAKSQHPDLILLDVMMPDISGFDTAVILKKEAATADIPIIFLTALNSPSDLVHGFQVGANDFLTKPFNKEELIMRVMHQISLVAAKRIIVQQNEELRRTINNRDKMYSNLHNSLMLVTALNPYIGYENAAKTAKKAYKENISLKEACVALGFLTAEKFDEVFHPEEMV